jgi:hypothetical protein
MASTGVLGQMCGTVCLLALLSCFRPSRGAQEVTAGEVADSLRQAEGRIGCMEVRYSEFAGRAQRGEGQSRETFVEKYLRGECALQLKEGPRRKQRSFVDFRSGSSIHEYVVHGQPTVVLINEEGVCTRYYPPFPLKEDPSAIIEPQVPHFLRAHAPPVRLPCQGMYWRGTDRRPLSDLLAAAETASIATVALDDRTLTKAVFAVDNDVLGLDGKAQKQRNTYDIYFDARYSWLPIRTDMYGSFLPKEWLGRGWSPGLEGNRALSVEDAQRDLRARLEKHGMAPDHYTYDGYIATRKPEYDPRFLMKTLLLTSVLCRDLREVSPGVNVPFIMSTLHFDAEGADVDIAEIRVEAFLLNEQVDPARRKIVFPVGTTVLNQITGVRYRVGISPESYPEEASRQIADIRSYQRGESELPRMKDSKAVQQRDAAMPAPEGGRGKQDGTTAKWWWMIAGSGMALACGVAVALRRRSHA